jgi:hypothetical protein
MMDVIDINKGRTLSSLPLFVFDIGENQCWEVGVVEAGSAKAGCGRMMRKASIAAMMTPTIRKNRSGLASLLFLPGGGAGCSMAGGMPVLIWLLSAGGGVRLFRASCECPLMA